MSRDSIEWIVLMSSLESGLYSIAADLAGNRHQLENITPIMALPLAIDRRTIAECTRLSTVLAHESAWDHLLSTWPTRYLLAHVTFGYV